MRKAQKTEYGNRDEKEKKRELSEAEQRRLRKFEETADMMIHQGYSRVDLTVSIVKANLFALILLIPLYIGGIWLYALKNGRQNSSFGLGSLGLFCLALVVLIVVHELIHGISWSLFAEHHWKDIEFGFMKQYLTPYCTCCVPLSRNQYIFGALMPLVLLGILPMIGGIVAGSMSALLMGIIMTSSAAGDILIAWKVLRYRSKAENITYMDHPTQAGGVIFEK